MADERRFPNVARSVTQARRFAVKAVGDVPRDIAEALEVMVSELATNSVKHAATQFTVRVDRDEDQIRIAVADTGPGQPAVRSPGPREPTGRGLRIVRALSDDWGVEPLEHGRGKVVWFTVDISSQRASA